MADTTAPPPSPVVEVLKAYAPSLGQCLVLLTGLLVGAATTLWINKPKPAPVVIAAPDPPRPSTIVSVSDVDHIVSQYCSGIGGKLDEILARMPAKKGGGK